MNKNFAAIVKRIAAEQGEAILGDPARLKPFIKNHAQNVPQDERRAFGRCIEAGAYAGLKNVHTQEERQQVKVAFLPHIQAASGLPAAQCRDALDTLEAVLFGTPQSAPKRLARQTPAPRQSGAGPQIYQSPPPVSAPGYQPAAYAPVPAKSHAPRNALIVVLALALIAALAAVVYQQKNTSPWQGYADYNSFAQAANFEETLGEPLTEEEFKAVISLTAFAALFSDEIQYDTMGGEELTEHYGVSRIMRQKYNYLVKPVDAADAAGRIAYFDGSKWIVLSVTQQQR